MRAHKGLQKGLTEFEGLLAQLDLAPHGREVGVVGQREVPPLHAGELLPELLVKQLHTAGCQSRDEMETE